MQGTLFSKPEIATYPGDITERKHGGNKESAEAFAKVDKHTDCRLILQWLKGNPSTSKEIAFVMGKALNTISGRFTEMNNKYIERTGEVRDGAAVWRLK